MYQIGDGVEKDLVKACQLYQKAAASGLVGAQYRLAKCYCTGEGIAKDPDKADQWYRKIAETSLFWSKFFSGWNRATCSPTFRNLERFDKPFGMPQGSRGPFDFEPGVLFDGLIMEDGYWCRRMSDPRFFLPR